MDIHIFTWSIFTVFALLPFKLKSTLLKDANRNHHLQIFGHICACFVGLSSLMYSLVCIECKTQIKETNASERVFGKGLV